MLNKMISGGPCAPVIVAGEKGYTSQGTERLRDCAIVLKRYRASVLERYRASVLERYRASVLERYRASVLERCRASVNSRCFATCDFRLLTLPRS